MIIKEYKNNKKTICYISKINYAGKDIFFVSTGKPSDKSCISWRYDSLDKAINTALEYFENITGFMKGITA